MALEHLDLTIKEWSALEVSGLVLPPHLMPQPAAAPAEAAPAASPPQQPQQKAQAAH